MKDKKKDYEWQFTKCKSRFMKCNFEVRKCKNTIENNYPTFYKCKTSFHKLRLLNDKNFSFF